MNQAQRKYLTKRLNDEYNRRVDAWENEHPEPEPPDNYTDEEMWKMIKNGKATLLPLNELGYTQWRNAFIFPQAAEQIAWKLAHDLWQKAMDKFAEPIHAKVQTLIDKAMLSDSAEVLAELKHFLEQE